MAIVARTTSTGLAYLARGGGRLDWASAEAEADTFLSVREATRAALTLPGKLRAFALPIRPAA
jgi:hypothetical protein